MPRINEIPFDSNRKMMTTIHKIGNKYRIITKGAPDILLNKCQNSIGEKQKLQREKFTNGRKGLKSNSSSI